jgi:hypothetical protein
MFPRTDIWWGASSRTGWDCERGFKAQNNSCVAQAMPKNAHIDYSGSDWACDLPYRRRGNNCQPSP